MVSTRAALVALAVTALAARPAGATAPELEAGRLAYQRGEFEPAVEHLLRALENPRAERADVLAAHRHLAALYLVLHDEPAARRHAAAALAIEPRARPPEGAPPEAEALFDRAAARRGASGARAQLALEFARAPRADDGARVRVRATGLPSGTRLLALVRCATTGAAGGGGGARAREVAALVRDAAALPVELELRALVAGERVACEATLATTARVALWQVVAEREVAAASSRVALVVGLVGAGVAASALAVGLGVWEATRPREYVLGAPTWGP